MQDSPSPSDVCLRAPALSRRMAVWLYESMLLFGVVFISGYLFSALTQMRHGLNNRTGLQIFVVIVLGIYFAWFWSKGQTLAMKTWRIRVVDQHGHRITQGRALVRYLLSWLWFLPPLSLGWILNIPPLTLSLLCLLWIISWALLSYWHPQRQFWHDAWARTYLVQVEKENRKKT